MSKKKIKRLKKIRKKNEVKTSNKMLHVMMDTAVRFSKLSSCKRRQLGATIAIGDHIISSGYNGTISGMDNRCEYTQFRCTKCASTSKKEKKAIKSCNCEFPNVISEDITNDFTLHAEENALAQCSKNGINPVGGTIFITSSPCVRCSKLIAQFGISTVYYKEKYKCTAGIDFLKETGIKVKQLKENKQKEYKYTISEKEIKLLVGILESKYDEMFDSNNNDFDFPQDWLLSEIRNINKEFQEYNRTPEEFDYDNNEMMDYAVFSILVEKLKNSKIGDD